MRLKIKSIKPNIQSISPEICIRTEIDCDSNVLPTEVSGELVYNNFKIANTIISHTRGDDFYVDFTNRSDRRVTYYLQIMIPLDRYAIEYLQSIRDKSERKDLNLMLRLVVKNIKSNIDQHKIEDGTTFLKNKSGHLLNVNVYDMIECINISSSDWVQVFLSEFLKENYLVLEIADPNITSKNLVWSDKLNGAISALGEIKKKLNQGEWTEAIEKARPVIELMNNNSELKVLFINSGLSSDAAGHLVGSISELFAFTSKFIHKLDRKNTNINPDMHVEKEDAYLVYSLSASLVNLIVKKINRLN